MTRPLVMKILGEIVEQVYGVLAGGGVGLRVDVLVVTNTRTTTHQGSDQRVCQHGAVRLHRFTLRFIVANLLCDFSYVSAMIAHLA
ncbi:MAG: hypothetical protein P4M11_02225, partial [Candidatus Pacebacteria bacterium]|nr:hypothetical protein [Candidatus Paceibacterota bacterium]